MLVGFLIASLGLGGYSLIGAGLRYFEMQELVDAALMESQVKRRVIMRAQNTLDGGELAQEVRLGILERARRSGLVLDEANLIVMPSERGVRVALNWSQPALSLGGQGILGIPMSIERIYEMRAVR